MSDAERTGLLFFVTGRKRLPLRSAAAHKVFSVRVSAAARDTIPTAHTCTAELVLPDYGTVEETLRKLRVAIENCEGFGFI
jgi:ubiquitin-protein ligase E3 A/E3 ubiquitin-protein ligase HERC3